MLRLPSMLHASRARPRHQLPGGQETPDQCSIVMLANASIHFKMLRQMDSGFHQNDGSSVAGVFSAFLSRRFARYRGKKRFFRRNDQELNEIVDVADALHVVHRVDDLLGPAEGSIGSTSERNFSSTSASDIGFSGSPLEYGTISLMRRPSVRTTSMPAPLSTFAHSAF